jgi:hypothetical protein
MIMKKILLCVGLLLSLGFAGCESGDEEVAQEPVVLAPDEEGTRGDDQGALGQPDAEDPLHQKVWISEDSLMTAFELLTGSWQLYDFRYDGKRDYHPAANLVLTFTKDEKYSCSSSAKETGSVEIYRIYRLEKNSSFSLSCLIKRLDILGPYNGTNYYDVGIEGDTLYIHENFFGTDFYKQNWYFKRQ